MDARFFTLALLVAMGQLCSDIQSIDGNCNNVQNPPWGETNRFYIRPPAGYQNRNNDGLPDPRTISNTIAVQDPVLLFNTHGTSLFESFFGQYVNHDLEDNDFTATSSCIAYLLPTDQLYTPNGTGTTNCILAQLSVGDTVDGVFQVINTNDAWLDLSVIYGFDGTTATSLRTGVNGQLLTQSYSNVNGGVFAPTFPPRNLANLLPNCSAIGFPDPGFLAPLNDPGDQFCSGDARASENVWLSIIHLIWVRNHNWHAAQLAPQFPVSAFISAHLRDEAIFQAARRLNIAEYQNVVAHQLLPEILDEPLPAYTGYDPTVIPDTSAAFATAAFRYGHSGVKNPPQVFNCSGQVQQVVQVSIGGTTLNQLPFTGVTLTIGVSPSDILSPLRNIFLAGGEYGQDGVSNAIVTLFTSLQAAMDVQMEDGLRNIFPPANDLFSVDMFRGRYNWLPNYNAIRTAYLNDDLYSHPQCQHPSVPGQDSLACFGLITSNASLAIQLQQLYGTVDRIDPFPGMLAEDHPGKFFGPTLGAIIGSEIARKRDADRFWYENPGVLSTSELATVQATSIGDIVERVTSLRGLPDNLFHVPPPLVGSQTYCPA